MGVLTKDFLTGLGIQLDDDTYAMFSEHFEETLSTRIIESIVDYLDSAQLEEFSRLQENSKEDQLWPWLEASIPELGDIIQDEIDILLGELAENSDQINEPTS